MYSLARCIIVVRGSLMCAIVKDNYFSHQTQSRKECGEAVEMALFQAYFRLYERSFVLNHVSAQHLLHLLSDSYEIRHVFFLWWYVDVHLVLNFSSGNFCRFDPEFPFAKPSYTFCRIFCEGCRFSCFAGFLAMIWSCACDLRFFDPVIFVGVLYNLEFPFTVLGFITSATSLDGLIWKFADFLAMIWALACDMGLVM